MCVADCETAPRARLARPSDFWLMAKLSLHEVRRIVLPLETAVDAVLELDREKGGWLSRGDLLGARLQPEPNPGLMIEVRPPGGGEVEQRHCSLTVIAAAFINYCVRSRIPVPRQANKRIAVVPEGFAVTIEGTFEVPRRHAALPSATYGAVAPQDAPAHNAGAESEAEPPRAG